MENEKEEEKEQKMSSASSNTKAIDKAIRFWTHPSVAAIPANEKIQYLHSRGLNDEDIHQVWERLVQENPPTNTAQEQAPSNASPPSYPQQGTTSVAPPPSQQYPQYAHQEQQQPLSQDYYNNNESSNMMDIPALLTIGGALGLTAAAAVRWLNGGDFCLLPPPTRGASSTINAIVNRHAAAEQQSQETTMETHVEEQEEEHDDDWPIEQQDETQPQTATMTSNNEAIQQVLEILETHSSQQEKILQQLSNYTTKQVTDQSMNLLRKHGNAREEESIQQELAEIKVELQILSSENNKGSEEWGEKLDECLKHLQECMNQVMASTTSTTAVSQNNNTAAPLVGTTTPSLAFEPRNNTVPTTTTTTSAENSKSVLVREAIRTLAEQNDIDTLRTGAQLLYLYVINLSSHPHVPRYRKIFTTNESFQKVEQLEGGKDLLVAVGFVEKGNCFEWQGGSDDRDVLYLKEAAAALSILKSCSDDSNNKNNLSTSALSVLRTSTPPPVSKLPPSALQTPVFIASPPNTKKHPLLDESGEDSILDISNASEHFESRLESLVQPVMDDVGFGASNDHVPKTNLSMRESEEDSSEEEEANGGHLESKGWDSSLNDSSAREERKMEEAEYGEDALKPSDGES